MRSPSPSLAALLDALRRARQAGGSRRGFMRWAGTGGLLVVAGGWASEDPPVSEPRLKAALLVKMVRFVIWPAPTFATPQTPLELGVLGASPFGEFLDRYVGTKVLEDHPLKVRYASSENSLSTCHVVYVAQTRDSSLADVVKAFAGRPVLLIGEEPKFASNGGMINLLIKDEKPHLEINLRATEEAGLKIRGQLAQSRNVEWIGKGPAKPR